MAINLNHPDAPRLMLHMSGHLVHIKAICAGTDDAMEYMEANPGAFHVTSVYGGHHVLLSAKGDPGEPYAPRAEGDGPSVGEQLREAQQALWAILKRIEGATLHMGADVQALALAGLGKQQTDSERRAMEGRG